MRPVMYCGGAGTSHATKNIFAIRWLFKYPHVYLLSAARLSSKKHYKDYERDHQHRESG